MAGKRAEQVERADAARNRRRVLEAAERLFARHGADGFWLAHVRALLAKGGRGQDEGRLDALVDVLLAPSPPSCTSTSASSRGGVGGGDHRGPHRPGPGGAGRRRALSGLTCGRRSARPVW